MKKQKRKIKLQTKVVVEKWLARALFLTKVETMMARFTIDAVHYDAKEMELAATDGIALLVVKIKPEGMLIPLNLETGFYDVVGDMLLKKDVVDNKREFPNYQEIIPMESKEVCANFLLLEGIVDCMVKNQVHLNIWKYENVLKILNRNFNYWSFVNESPVTPVLMKADNSKYDVKYIIMPIVK